MPQDVPEVQQVGIAHAQIAFEPLLFPLGHLVGDVLNVLNLHAQNTFAPVAQYGFKFIQPVVVIVLIQVTLHHEFWLVVNADTVEPNFAHNKHLVRVH